MGFKPNYEIDDKDARFDSVAFIYIYIVFISYRKCHAKNVV